MAQRPTPRNHCSQEIRDPHFLPDAPDLMHINTMSEHRDMVEIERSSSMDSSGQRKPHMSNPYDENRAELATHRTSNVWKRGIIMLLFLFCFGIAQWVLYALTVVQFLWMLINGERNAFLATFGRSLGLWLAEMAWFLSGDTEERPFPWRPWPRD
jgi:hypothetical protein